VIADLDTLLTALYVELTDHIIPARGFARPGPGRPPEVTNAELVCLAVAQALLRHDDERPSAVCRWSRASARRWCRRSHSPNSRCARQVACRGSADESVDGLLVELAGMIRDWKSAANAF
jgi:hypothetical protein